MNAHILAALAGLSAARGVLSESELRAMLAGGGLRRDQANEALREALRMGWFSADRSVLRLTPAGGAALLDATARLHQALDPSPTAPGMDTCPSIPWLTTVQTRWIEAFSLNYAVDPAALAALLPAPVKPEIFEGSAWVQVLMSSLEGMRPQGLPSVFGVNFYQVCYRAAVWYPGANGPRRGGYFVRSETNHPVMRLVGNTLVEFRFHAFGDAEIVALRDGPSLYVGVQTTPPGGEILATLDTRPLPGPPEGSVWRSIEHLHVPLVECYDAFGVDAQAGYVYVLTVDREPWAPTFVQPTSLYCAWMQEGPLGPHSRFDSALRIQTCAYRWRPLRRERIVGWTG